MIEIIAEAALPDRLRQVGVRGADDPRVDRLARSAAEPAHRPFLDGLQHLGLQQHRQEANLVEEKRPTVRELEQPRLGSLGIGERAALEAEQLSLEEPVGDRRAVDVHERAVRARPDSMEQSGDKAFARTGFPLDQN